MLVYRVRQLSVKARATAKPAASTMSTDTDRVPATGAIAAPPGGVIDSITDTDTTVADMSGAGPAGTSQTDKPTSRSDSNFRASLADSTTTKPRALGDDDSADVANRPRPPQAARPQRIRRKPARLIDSVHAQWVIANFRLVDIRHLVRLELRVYSACLVKST